MQPNYVYLKDIILGGALLVIFVNTKVRWLSG